jgi:hypothetical protein
MAGVAGGGGLVLFPRLFSLIMYAGYFQFLHKIPDMLVQYQLSKTSAPEQ